MPNTRSSKKRMRQAVKLRRHNRQQRSALRTAVKNVRQAASPDDAAQAYRAAARLLDRAARKGMISKNKAARDKSRLHRIAFGRSSKDQG